LSIGLLALLDDVAAIAKVAAASLDDVATQAAKAGAKAVGVVIDDAAICLKLSDDGHFLTSQPMRHFNFVENEVSRGCSEAENRQNRSRAPLFQPEPGKNSRKHPRFGRKVALWKTNE